MGTQSASTKRSAEQKLVGNLGDPKCKCKKVSGAKIVEQKHWNKNNKIKIGGDPQTLDDGQVQKGQWNKNRGTKTAEEKLVGTLGDLKCKCKKVSGTKIGGDP